MTEGFDTGASLRREEDGRFLRGRRRSVGDLRSPGMLQAAFLRSPVARARLPGVRKPAGQEGRAFAERLAGVGATRAVSGPPGFRTPARPVPARGKPLHVGECVATGAAPSRAEVEDPAERVAEAAPQAAPPGRARAAAVRRRLGGGRRA